ncbi:MAG: hypothetical protein AAGN35_02265 [Bacteroidota bacterium]
MDKPTDSRHQLKLRFAPGTIPSSADFGALIDSQLNEKDDLIQREQIPDVGNSLAIGGGVNGALMSFYPKLNNKNKGWLLEFDNQGEDLNLRPIGAIIPTLYLDGAGNIGVGKATPQTTLDVGGAVQAETMTVLNNLQADSLEINGTAVIKKLILNGKEVSAKGISGGGGGGSVQSPPGSGSVNFGSSGSSQSLRAQVAQLGQRLVEFNDRITNVENSSNDHSSSLSTAGGRTGSSALAMPTTSNPATSASKTAAPAISPAATTLLNSLTQPTVKTVTADGNWQDLVANLSGYHAYQVMAWINDSDGKNYSLVHAIAVNVRGDHSSSAITTTSSYMGTPSGVVNLRWQSSAQGVYALQARTRRRFPGTVPINYYLVDLLPRGLSNTD